MNQPKDRVKAVNAALRRQGMGKDPYVRDMALALLDADVASEAPAAVTLARWALSRDPDPDDGAPAAEAAP